MMRVNAAAVAVLVWLAFPAMLAAAPAADTLRVTAEVAPAVVRVGERVAVRFTVAAPDSGARLLGPPAPMAFGEVDVVVSGPAPAGPDSLGWALEAALFEVGDHDLSAIPFTLESASGSRPLRLRPYTVSVETVLPDSLAGAGIRDIAPPVDLPARWRWRNVILAAVVLVLAAVGLLYWWRRPRKETPFARPVMPAVPPEVEARRALAALERDALPARGRIKEHYARLSLILRGYMERRWPLPAVESTTEEIRAALAEGSWLVAGRRDEILTLFGEADLVKFARHNPGTEAADQALHRGRGWLEAVVGIQATEARLEGARETAPRTEETPVAEPRSASAPETGEEG